MTGGPPPLLVPLVGSSGCAQRRGGWLRGLHRVAQSSPHATHPILPLVFLAHQPPDSPTRIPSFLLARHQGLRPKSLAAACSPPPPDLCFFSTPTSFSWLFIRPSAATGSRSGAS
ncbi:hypothetical protein VPH35_022243 [Triticum aestivum]